MTDRTEAGFGNSSRVSGNQEVPSDRLPELVRRHLSSEWRKPIGDPTYRLWRELSLFWTLAVAEGRDVILDSGCGTGESSEALTRLHPRATVIGVDRSLVRLKTGLSNISRRRKIVWEPGIGRENGEEEQLFRISLDGRLILSRGELTDLWRLALASGFSVKRHYLLYPNPSPLRAHLIRRWHGHPVFPKLPLLAPVTELRTNWKVYADEFALGWELLGEERPETEPWVPEEPLTPFEKKYRASGHPLWRVVARSSRFSEKR